MDSLCCTLSPCMLLPCFQIILSPFHYSPVRTSVEEQDEPVKATVERYSSVEEPAFKTPRPRGRPRKNPAVPASTPRTIPTPRIPRTPSQPTPSQSSSGRVLRSRNTNREASD